MYKYSLTILLQAKWLLKNRVISVSMLPVGNKKRPKSIWYNKHFRASGMNWSEISRTLVSSHLNLSLRFTFGLIVVGDQSYLPCLQMSCINQHCFKKKITCCSLLRCSFPKFLSRIPLNWVTFLCQRQREWAHSDLNGYVYPRYLWGWTLNQDWDCQNGAVNQGFSVSTNKLQQGETKY